MREEIFRIARTIRPFPVMVILLLSPSVFAYGESTSLPEGGFLLPPTGPAAAGCQKSLISDWGSLRAGILQKQNLLDLLQCCCCRQAPSDLACARPPPSRREAFSTADCASLTLPKGGFLRTIRQSPLWYNPERCDVAIRALHRDDVGIVPQQKAVKLQNFPIPLQMG